MSILKNFSFVLKTESLSKIAETLIKSAFERLFCYFVQFLCSHVFHVLIPLSKMAETLIKSSFFDKGIFHVLQDALQFRFSEYDADYKYFNADMYVSSHGNGNLSVPERFCIPVGNAGGIFNPALACSSRGMGNDPGIFPRRHAYQDSRRKKGFVWDWRNPVRSIRHLGIFCIGYAQSVDIAGYGNVLAVFGTHSVFGKCAYDGVFCGSGSNHGRLVKKKTK